MKLYIASDHAGVELKTELYRHLMNSQFIPGTTIEVIDLGPHSTDSVDYPDYADKLCQSLHGLTLVQAAGASLPSHLSEMGILICGSGQGMNIRANKYTQIRAALCWNTDVAKLSREHNNANVLCLGARFLTPEQALDIVRIFLSTPFAGGRHLQRVAKIGNPI